MSDCNIDKDGGITLEKEKRETSKGLGLEGGGMSDKTDYEKKHLRRTEHDHCCVTQVDYN